MKRLLTASIILLAGVASVAWTQVAPPAAPVVQPDPVNFTGKVTGHATTDIRMLRYSFEPGARTNWHSHAAGQVIVIESGRARVQERGGPSASSDHGRRWSSSPESPTGTARCQAGR